MTTAPQTFGALLRRYQVAAGLTQEALAEQAGLSTRGLSDLERGARRRPYRHTVQQLARALGLTGDQCATLLATSRRVGGAPAAAQREATPPPPRPLTTFVGRDRDVAEVTRLLASARLLTLTGAGGIGKTRLALEVARGAARGYRDGVALAELAGLADALLVPQAVASALAIHEQSGRPLRQTLVDALRSRRLLLVLDNCEHLVQACAELAELLLRACPDLRILATSRQALRIGGEVAWRVPSLEVPPPSPGLSGAELSQTGAGELFTDRARAAAPGFVVGAHNAAGVARICRRLDGIPLALELAAARVPALGVAQLSERLEEGFRLLTGGSRTALPRQQSLRATVDWSCRLLTGRERRLFERLAVFAGGWSLAAAEAVCGGEDLPPAAVLELLMRLVDQSLVVAEERDGAQRYRLLEPIRQYALERLGAWAAAPAVRRRHAGYFTALAEAAEPQVLGPNQAAWLDRLEQEHDNLRAVLAWSTGAGAASAAAPVAELGLRLAAAMGLLWHVRGHWREGRRWLAAALTAAPGAPGLLRAKAFNAAGWLAWDQGDDGRAEALSQEALGLSRGLGDPWSVAWSAGRLSHVRWTQGRYAEAAALATEALGLFRRLEAPWYVGWALHQLGRVAHVQGDAQRAAALFEASLGQFRASGDRGVGTAFQFANLGDVARGRGDALRAMRLYEEALAGLRELGFKQGLVHTLHSLADLARAQGAGTRSGALLREALLLCRDLGDAPGIAASLEGLAELAQADGRRERAARLAAAAEALRHTAGRPPPAADGPHRRHRAALCAELGEEAAAAIWRAGWAASPADAIAYALEPEPAAA